MAVGRRIRRKKAPESSAGTGKVKPVILGALAGLLFTMVGILLFALVIKITGLSDDVIPPVNQVIKMSAVGTAAIVAASKAKNARILCGSLAGVAYVLIGFLVFSLIQGTFSIGVELLSDMLMGLIGAAIVSMLFTKLARKMA